jgi:hypothetical protein
VIDYTDPKYDGAWEVKRQHETLERFAADQAAKAEKEASIKAKLVISDEEIAEMLTYIKPLVCFKGDSGEQAFIALPDNLRNTAFRWDPVITEKADMSRFHVLAEIETYHTCGYHMFFKPTIPEVLAQIPKDLVLQVAAFQVLIDDVEIITDGFYGHKAKTILYRAADNCSICKGARGGVAGNCNIIDGKVVCDYCHCDMDRSYQ